MEKFCLSWKDFSVNSTLCFQELRSEEELFDVTLACDDHRVEAHKVILASCSPVFKAIVSGNKTQNQLIYLRGLVKQDLDYMMDYIYSGTVNVLQEGLKRFLDIAADFKLKGLTDVQTTDKSKGDNDNVDIKQEDWLVDQKIPGEPISLAEEIKPLEKEKSKARKLKKEPLVLEPPPFMIHTEEEIKRYDHLVNSKMEKKGKYWYCLECGKEFMPRNKTCAFRHVDLNHMSQYSFVCKHSHCGRSFVAKSNINYHYRNCKEDEVNEI